METREIISVKTITVRKVYDLSVDTNHNFLITKKNIIVHNSGKSYLGCLWIICNSMRYAKTRYLIGRAVLKNLKESTLLTFFEVCTKLGLVSDRDYTYNSMNNVIKFWNGSEVYLKDLFQYPSDPEFDSLGSTEFTAAFIDEASQITEKAKNVVSSRLRFRLDEYNLIPKILFCTNPTKNFLYYDFFMRHREGTLPSYRKFIPALVGDNPFISKHYVEQLQKLDQVTKERLLFGNWNYDSDPSRLIEYDKILDLFTNKIPHGEQKYISCDIARFGDDKTTIWVWHGLAVVEFVEMAKRSTKEVRIELERLEAKHQVPRSNIIVDEDGVGCLHPKTEVFTPQGWKLAKDIRIGDDIYSCDENEVLEIRKVYEATHLEDERFLEIGKGVRFTDSHYHLYRTRKENAWRYAYWDEVSQKQSIYANQSFKWIGKDADLVFQETTYEMPNGGMKRLDNAIVSDTNRFARLLGWFVSEGSFSNKNYISIVQKETSWKNKHIVEALDEASVRYTTKTSKQGAIQYVFCQKALKKWLFEECYGLSKHAHGKKIPCCIKNSTTETILKFLEAFRLGDGYMHHGLPEFVSSSKQLADDLQECLFKCGYNATIAIKQPKGSVFYIDGRKVIRQHDMFVVYCTKELLRISRGFKKEFRSPAINIRITGQTKLYLVRFNGRIMWTHNGGIKDEMNGIKGFVNNSSPIQSLRATTPSNYANLKSQCYFKLADYINTGKIGIDCFYPVEAKKRLIEDLEQVRQKDIDKDGKLSVVPKDMVKDKLGRSPDYSDGLMLRMYYEVRQYVTPTIGSARIF